MAAPSQQKHRRRPRSAPLRKVTAIDRSSMAGPLAIKGFDYQSGYALWRLATGLADRALESVGIERTDDVDVTFTRGGVRHVEVVQVKSYRVGLTEVGQLVDRFRGMPPDTATVKQAFAILSTGLDDRVRSVAGELNRFRGLRVDDPEYRGTRVKLAGHLEDLSLPVDFVLDKVRFEILSPDLDDYKRWLAPLIRDAIHRIHAADYKALNNGVRALHELIRVPGRAVTRAEALETLAEELGAPPRPGGVAGAPRWLSERHARFGGRHKELARIGTFLGTDRGYLLVEGLAGFGKTALLVHVVQSHPKAISHFFSEKFGNRSRGEFLSSAYLQLAAIGAVRTALPATDAEREAAIAECLGRDQARGSKLVVLLDAVDEADFSLQPLFVSPGRGVHVIYSARSIADRDWRALIPPGQEVNVVQLGALTLQDVRAITRKTGHGDTLLADQLHAATSGDPFFLGLLVEDLVRDAGTARETIRNLARPVAALNIYEKLDSYLRQELRTPPDGAAREGYFTALGILASAQGPLRSQELLAIGAGHALDETNIDQVLAAMQRFVVGAETTGYALWHERFAEYVRRRLPDRCAAAAAALKQHCAGWQVRNDAANQYVFESWLQHVQKEAQETRDPRRYVRALSWDFLRRKAISLRETGSSLEDIEAGVALLDCSEPPLAPIERSELIARLTLLEEGLLESLSADAQEGLLVQRALLGGLDAAASDALRLSNPRERVLELLLMAEVAWDRDPDDRSGRGRRLLEHVAATCQAQRVFFAHEEEEEMIDLATRLKGNVRRAALRTLTPILAAGAGAELVSQLQLAIAWTTRQSSRAASQKPSEARKVRAAARKIDEILKSSLWLIRGLEDRGSPLERLPRQYPEARKAIGLLAQGGRGSSAALIELGQVWARHRAGLTPTQNSFEGKRLLIGRPAPPREMQAAPPALEAFELVRLELVDALLKADDTTGAASTTAHIRAPEYRAVGLARLARHTTGTASALAARQAADLLEERSRAPSRLTGLSEEDERDCIDAVARVKGEDAAGRLIHRYYKGTDHGERPALQAFIRIRHRAQPVDSIESAFREAQSLIEFYREPWRGWHVMHSIVLAAGESALTPYLNLIEVTQSVQEIQGPRFTHTPFILCSRALFAAISSPGPLLDVWESVDRILPEVPVWDVHSKGAWARPWLFELVARRLSAFGAIAPAETASQLHDFLENGVQGAFAGWPTGTVRDIMSTLAQIDGDAAGKVVAGFAAILDRPSQVPRYELAHHVSWQVALGDLAGLSGQNDARVDALASDYQRIASKGIQESWLPSVEACDCMHPKHALALLVPVLQGMRRGPEAIARAASSGSSRAGNDSVFRLPLIVRSLMRARLALEPAESWAATASRLAGEVVGDL